MPLQRLRPRSPTSGIEASNRDRKLPKWQMPNGALLSVEAHELHGALRLAVIFPLEAQHRLPLHADAASTASASEGLQN